MCSYEDKLNRKTVRLWLRSVAQNRSFSRQQTTKFYLHVEESGAHYSKVPKTFRARLRLAYSKELDFSVLQRDRKLKELKVSCFETTQTQLCHPRCARKVLELSRNRPLARTDAQSSFVEPTWILLPMHMVRDSVLAKLRMRKLNNKCAAPLDDVEETRPSKWHQRVLHLVNPMWIFSPRIWDFSSRVAAHAPTKCQSNSTSGRGARASYQTMLPEISARRSLLWVKLQIPVARQGGREMSAPRPRVTDPFHPLSSIPR